MSTTTLDLSGHVREIIGSGDELKLTVRAIRQKRTGRYESYEITLQMDRFNVRRFLEQVRLLHVRDRERMTREAERIESELSSVRS